MRTPWRKICVVRGLFNEPSVGYVRSDYGIDRESRPQIYIPKWGSGSVLYFYLGQCAGKHDMKPLAAIVPIVRRSQNLLKYCEVEERSKFEDRVSLE